MDYLYGELNSRAIKVEYTGLDTSTTVTTVNNADNINTIKVDVKKLTPQILSAQEPTDKGTYFLTVSKNTGGMAFGYIKDLPEEVVKNVINPSVLNAFLEAGDNVAIEQLEDKVKISASVIPGFIYASQSTVYSSEVPETTIIQKSDIYGKSTGISTGDSIIFPDISGNLTSYIGNVSEVTEDNITVNNIKYIKNNTIMKGAWKSGPANYPECYTYNGYNWLCQKNNINTNPIEGNDWLCLGPIQSNTVYFNLDEQKLETEETKREGKYTISIDKLYPKIPFPVIDNIVVFATDKANYVGKITDIKGADVVVEVKLAFTKSIN